MNESEQRTRTHSMRCVCLCLCWCSIEAIRFISLALGTLIQSPFFLPILLLLLPPMRLFSSSISFHIFLFYRLRSSLSLSLIHLHLSTAWIAFGKSFIGNNLMHKRNILFYFQLTIVCARFAVLLFCFGCNFCYLHFTVVLLLLVVIQLEITSSCKRFKLNWTETQNSEVFVFNGFSNETNIAWEWYCMSELANMLVIISI